MGGKQGAGAGGIFYKQQFLEYNILLDVMVDHGPNVLTQDVYDSSMYFSQYDHSLYIKHGETIAFYDLSSSLFPSDVSIIHKGASNVFGVSACVAASEDFLFVVGGYYGGNWIAILNVLSLPDHVWSLGPGMQISRVNQGCVVMSDNYFYAIAGGRVQNERISIHNLQNQQWQLIEPLTEIVDFHGIAPYEDVIWVFGGRDRSSPVVYWDKIWNIHTKDGSVALLNESLPSVFSLWTGTMTLVGNVVYFFGDQSVKYVIRVPSDNASEASPNPTINPSFNPTKVPSHMPSEWPITFSIKTTNNEQEQTQYGALKPPKPSGMNSVTLIIITVCVFSVVACIIVIGIWCLVQRIWFENNKKMPMQRCTTSKDDHKDDCGPLVPAKCEMTTANMVTMQGDTRTVPGTNMKPCGATGAVMRGNGANDMIQQDTHEMTQDDNENAMQSVQSEGIENEICLEGNADYMATSGNIAPDEFVIDDEEDHTNKGGTME
eukprot:459324_1